MNILNPEYLILSEVVKTALVENKPIVALESTIISHGMPYPQNLETALNVERTVREHGAVPATIAIINGKIKAGLSAEDLEILANGSSTGQEILKASRRDIPFIISQKLNAATTVAATMIFAEMAGIKIFATGGIGGVHRNAQNTFDISADLTELANSNVAVVSAGVKSILDIGLTLEYLETLGVPVIGYRTEEFPAFYTIESGFKVNFKLNSPEEISDVLQKKWELGLKGGVIIANPIPEEFSMDKKLIDNAIEGALEKAEDKNIKGKDLTPYLLSEIKIITSGKSLESNINLVLNNAGLAAEISVCLCRIFENNRK
ncbi:MAG TPA: pseudouridine-5'-phosphate glycosidase [Ignavibacteria bacterium]|nr:pseudouridine-5'-phosphate glycosidase [Ignavibacteria bacterium]